MSSHTLTIIEERSTEDRMPLDRRGSEIFGSTIFASNELPLAREAFMLSLHPTEIRTDPFPIHSHSPGMDRMPMIPSSQSFELGLESSPTVSILTSEFSKGNAKEEKARKAEAKRMKKAEQKARIERLAEELKERERRRAAFAHWQEDRGSVRSHSSGGRGEYWGGLSAGVRGIAMYDGLGAREDEHTAMYATLQEDGRHTMARSFIDGLVTSLAKSRDRGQEQNYQLCM